MGTLVLLSGGMDSAVAAAWAKRTLPPPYHALSVDYGSVHNERELSCARKIAGLLGMEWHQARVVLPEGMASGLLKGHEWSQRLAQGEQARERGLPVSFVPARNAILLSLAAGLAYSLALQHVVGGMHPGDNFGYPDCRQQFLQSMERSLQLALDEYPLQFHFPYHSLLQGESDAVEAKATVIRLAMQLDVLPLLRHTHTCYQGQYPPCGQCAACQLRAKAFERVGIEDPLLTG